MVRRLPELMLLWECSHFLAGSIRQGWFGAVAPNFWSASADVNLMGYGQLRMVSEIVGLATQPEAISLYEHTSCGITPNVGKAFQGHPTLFWGGLGVLGSTSFRGQP